jgi:hypothetical protein
VLRCSPSNLTELERICRQEWEKLSKYRCVELVASYLRRLKAAVPDASLPEELNAFNALLFSFMFTTTNIITQFATKVVDLITETACREEVRELAVWCQDNNLSLNVRKIKDLIVDYTNYRLRACK